jgi:membrane protein DedA with SNARE-associated domain
MKNPFVKEDDSSLVIVAVAVGAILAGAIAYLYTQKNGNPFVNKVADVAEEVNEHATDYLKKKSHHLKKKTTDLHEIEDIVRG